MALPIPTASDGCDPLLGRQASAVTSGSVSANTPTATMRNSAQPMSRSRGRTNPIDVSSESDSKRTTMTSRIATIAHLIALPTRRAGIDSRRREQRRDEQCEDESDHRRGPREPIGVVGEHLQRHPSSNVFVALKTVCLGHWATVQSLGDRAVPTRNDR